MKVVEQFKRRILDLAIRGKLVPQDPNDEPASILLERIKAEKAKLVKAGKIKKEKNPSEIVVGSDGAAYEKFGRGDLSHAEARRRGGSMDFLMESGFMHWMSERMSFTNWVKADFHETSRITLKFSAPPRLRVRYRLGAGSSRYGNCFF